MVDLFRYRHWDLVSKRSIYYVISGLMLLIGIIAMVVNKTTSHEALNYGIDFKGGGLVTYQLADNTHFSSDNQRAQVGRSIREALKAKGIENEVKMAVGEQGNGDQIIVTTLLGEGAKEKKGLQLEDEILNTITPIANEEAKKALPGAPVADMQVIYPAPAVDAVMENTLIDSMEEALKTKGITGRVKIVAGENGDQLIVQSAYSKDNEAKTEQDITATVNAQLQKNLPGTPAIEKPSTVTFNVVRTESYDVVSGTIKDDLIVRGVLSMVVGTMLIMLWIWFRYNIGGLGLRYSVAGLIALGHDLLTLVGLFALLHTFLQVNSPFIAALLTVLGYSIHDTIVIFDRIRENVRLRKGRTFAETVNISLLETLARSVNTVLTTLLVLLALFFFGGSTLRDFVAAMLIGIVLGGYSSIFVASQLLVSWSKKEQKVILPEGAPVPAMAGAAPLPAKAPIAVASGAAAAPIEPAAAVPSKEAAPASEAIQRAKQAGKTSRRRR